jgi:protein-tyrosine phosphatase
VSEQRKETRPPPADHSHPYEVAEGLFISGHPEHSRDFLTRGVDAVIDLEGDIDSSISEAESPDLKTLYIYWPIEDGALPDVATVRALAAFVARSLDEKKEVLVHCRSGHNRSGLICARTLIEQGLAPDEAIETVRRQRRDGQALGNENFVNWLRQEQPPQR